MSAHVIITPITPALAIRDVWVSASISITAVIGSDSLSSIAVASSAALSSPSKTRLSAVIRMIAGRVEKAGKDAGNESLQCRETGTNDGDVCFNARPRGSTDIVPADIFGDGDYINGVKAEDGGYADAGNREYRMLKCAFQETRLGGVGNRGTYNPPRANTPIKANFCLFGMFKDLSMGMGIAKVMISVRMFNAALENQKASSLKQ